MPEPPDPRSYRNLEDYHSDLEAHDEALGAFHDLVKTSFDLQEVEKWVRVSPMRQNLFDDMAVGQIRWPRSLGQPDAPNLSDGFVITSKWWADAWHIALDGSIVVDINGWMPGTPPQMRDGLSETDYYSVRYLFHQVQVDNEVEVQFSHVAWHHPSRSVHHLQLYLSSHGYQFPSDGKFITLPDITVDTQPFVHQ